MSSTFVDQAYSHDNSHNKGAQSTQTKDHSPLVKSLPNIDETCCTETLMPLVSNGNTKHVDDPFQAEDLVQDTQIVDLDTSLTLVKSNLQHTTVDKTVEFCLDSSVAQTKSDALPVRSKAPLKSKDPKNVSKSRTKVDSAASGESVITGLDPQQSETFLGPPMEHGKNSNASQTMQHVNKIDSESGHAKAKKPTSRSQSKVKHDPNELAQVNKQQADCISDLEHRLNEIDQFNQILQKRLDLSKHSDKITGSSRGHNSVPSQENYLECENRNDRKTEMRDPHCMEAGVVVPPLIYQLMIDNKIMENKVRELELKSSIDQALQMRNLSHLQTLYPNQLPIPATQPASMNPRSPLEPQLHPQSHIPGYGWRMAAGPVLGPLVGNPYHLNSQPMYAHSVPVHHLQRTINMQHGNVPYYAHSVHVPGYHPQSNINMQHGNALYYAGSNLQFQRAGELGQNIPPINPPAYGMRDGRNYLIDNQNHVNLPNRQPNEMQIPHQRRKHNYFNSHKSVGSKGNSQTSNNMMPASYMDVNLTNVTDVPSREAQRHDPIVNINRADIQLAPVSEVIDVEQYHDGPGDGWRSGRDN